MNIENSENVIPFIMWSFEYLLTVLKYIVASHWFLKCQSSAMIIGSLLLNLQGAGILNIAAVMFVNDQEMS